MRRAQSPRGLGDLEGREALGKALRGAVFPLSPEQLILVARENEAPTLVLSLLSVLPRQQFSTLEAVTHALEAGPPEVPAFGSPQGPAPQR